MLLFLDIESTGIQPETDSILEISAARFDGVRVIDAFDRLIRIPEELEIPKNISLLTGITKEMLEIEGTPFEEVKKSLEAFFRPDDIITGHNISFDTTFLKQNGVQIPEQELDTFVLSTIVLEQEESCSLEILTEKYGLTHENAHRAMSDVLANIELWKLLQQECVRQMTPFLREKVKNILQNSTFPEGIFFEEVLSLKKGGWDEVIPSPKNVPSSGTQNAKISASLVEEIIKKKEKVIMSVQFPKKTLFSLFLKEEKMAVLFPRQSLRRFFEIFQRAQKEFPEKKGIFLSAPELKIDKDALAKFLEKSRFSRLESIVALKILFAIESDFSPDFSFSGEEWNIARSLLMKTSVFPQELFDAHDLFFAPISDIFSIPENIPVVFFNAHEIEESLTEMLETKVYSRHLQESLFRYTEKNSEPPCAKAVYLFLEEISKALREKLGESAYPITLQIDDALWRDSAFQPLLKQFEALFGEQAFLTLPEELHHIWKEWSVFSENFREENKLFCFQLFPSNEFSLSAVPIDISFAINNILKRDAAVFFLGSAFPRREDGTVHFSFSFPSEIKEYRFLPEPSVFFEETIFLPKGSGDLSPKDIFPFLEALLHGESGNILFSVNSQKIAGIFEDLLLDLCEHRGIKLLSPKSGSAGKIRSFLKRSGRKILIATPKLLDDIHAEDFSFPVVLILKFSFDPKGNPLLDARKRQFRNEFLEFAVPRSKARFAKEVFRCINLTHPVFTLVFDARLGDADGFGKSFQSVFTEGVQFKRISPEDIRTLFPDLQKHVLEEQNQRSLSYQHSVEQGSLF